MTHVPRRNGLQQAIRRVKQFCAVYVVFSVSMKAAIDASPVGTDAEKTAAKAAVDTINSACHALLPFAKSYEP